MTYHGQGLATYSIQLERDPVGLQAGHNLTIGHAGHALATGSAGLVHWVRLESG